MSELSKSPLTDGKFEKAVREYQRRLKLMLIAPVIFVAYFLLMDVVPFMINLLLFPNVHAYRLENDPYEFGSAIYSISLAVIMLGAWWFYRRRFDPIARNANPPVSAELKHFVYLWGREQPPLWTRRNIALMIGAAVFGCAAPLATLPIIFYMALTSDGGPIMSPYFIPVFQAVALVFVVVAFVVSFHFHWKKSQIWYQTEYGVPA